MLFFCFCVIVFLLFFKFCPNIIKLQIIITELPNVFENNFPGFIKFFQVLKKISSCAFLL